MNARQRKSYVGKGVLALRSGQGYATFLLGVLVTGLVTFLAMTGAQTLLIEVALNEYGVDRALAEMRVVSGDQAFAAFRGLLLSNLPVMLLAAGVVGVLFGLAKVGRQAEMN